MGKPPKRDNTEKTMSQPATITSGAQIHTHDGQPVRLVGRYVQQDVRMMPRPPARHIGHVALVLDDDTAVLLAPTWHSNAIRPKDEIQQLEGKRVIATGTLHEKAPANPEGAANLEMPCLLPVDSVAAAP